MDLCLNCPVIWLPLQTSSKKVTDNYLVSLAWILGMNNEDIYETYLNTGK